MIRVVGILGAAKNFNRLMWERVNFHGNQGALFVGFLGILGADHRQTGGYCPE
jgi:hypothetical protein